MLDKKSIYITHTNYSNVANDCIVHGTNQKIFWHASHFTGKKSTNRR